MKNVSLLKKLLVLASCSFCLASCNPEKKETGNCKQQVGQELPKQGSVKTPSESAVLEENNQINSSEETALVNEEEVAEVVEEAATDASAEANQ